MLIMFVSVRGFGLVSVRGFGLGLGYVWVQDRLVLGGLGWLVVSGFGLGLG